MRKFIVGNREEVKSVMVKEEDVCCVGCNERVCSFNEEPPHKDSRDEAVCDECRDLEEEEEKGMKDVKLDTDCVICGDYMSDVEEEDYKDGCNNICDKC
mgnify:CR=1 FL=1